MPYVDISGPLSSDNSAWGDGCVDSSVAHSDLDSNTGYLESSVGLDDSDLESDTLAAERGSEFQASPDAAWLVESKVMPPPSDPQSKDSGSQPRFTLRIPSIDISRARQLGTVYWNCSMCGEICHNCWSDHPPGWFGHKGMPISECPDANRAIVDPGADTRLALGQTGALGDFYDARQDKIISKSLLKHTPCQEAIQVVHNPSMNYKIATIDTLEEKSSLLGISLDLQASVLCGLIQGGWGAAVLSPKTSDSHVLQASTICTRKTCFEKLQLQCDELKDILNLDMLETKEATHVICGIEWGATIVVTICTDNMLASNHLTNACNVQNDEVPGVPGMIHDVAAQIGKVHANVEDNVGDNSDSHEELLKRTFDFHIISDTLGNMHNNLRTDYDGVVKFIRSASTSLQNCNNGKGVPVVFHLRPLEDVARDFKRTLAERVILKKLVTKTVVDCVETLEELLDIQQRFVDYHKLLASHAFCLPKSHTKKVGRLKVEAERNYSSMKNGIAKCIMEARQGYQSSLNELEILVGRRGDSDDIESGPFPRQVNIFDEYVAKIKFADKIRGMNATYLSQVHGGLDTYLADFSGRGTETVYVLHYSEACLKHSDWSDNEKEITRLASKTGDYGVIVVDHDIISEQLLCKPRIEKYYSKSVLSDDIVRDLRQLDLLCLVQCGDTGELEHLKSDPPTGSRVLRIPCPCRSQFGGKKNRWICPNCREVVYYGVIDNYLYCGCNSRYSASAAIFKCTEQTHSHEFQEHDQDSLKALLVNLEDSEVYNILLLGETGSGKSTFINALANYLHFDSLEDALQSNQSLPCPIPTAFNFTVNSDGHEKHSVNVEIGSETENERFSRQGESATRKTVVYSFDVGGATVRVIDTPGICDTDGVLQDHKNVKDILRTLESLDTLHAVLFLLPPNLNRFKISFRFGMTELLSHLHVDLTENILFGFTHASTTDFDVGDTAICLNRILKELGTKLVREDLNSFCFDSIGFRYLSACRQVGYRLPGLTKHADIWAKSADEVYRLVKTVRDLRPHQVKKTLGLNRARQLLEGLAKPLTAFATDMKKTKADMESLRIYLDKLSLQDLELADKLRNCKITITVPVRHNLPKARMVCAHSACQDLTKDYTASNADVYRVCHESCTAKAPEEIVGSPEIKNCYAFRKWFFFYGYTCACGHEWTDHMRISYELVHEKRPDNEKIQNDIMNNEQAKLAYMEKVETLNTRIQEIKAEEAQIRHAQTVSGCYLKHHSMVKSEVDATVRYLAQQLNLAETLENPSRVRDLKEQRKLYEDTMMGMMFEIRSGVKKVPDDYEIDTMLNDLTQMKNFGSHLRNALDVEPLVMDSCRLVSVPPSADKKKGFRFKLCFWRE